ncbi:MAG: helix-turn-helix transcriptional regulator [Thiotrichales bacterium]|jgi:predicted transcriptional regulator|nr:helix-turn-helix transcriptional regulator [Thiotrichales bacterium]MBT3613469.1 helix-turn-helix transcriptional regulator [Thiotrichales bacterium]MBT3753062.1 helix-turn-helix transcriptional regulator [Thiotrichales bacterium]MBT3837345.1 helix-turn-helix transcriptional regulator [Thiotrichales bacterium]MBT4151631.1 helix-turn-helix transcriptional regulator [Thiotrichales bacterium]
MNKIIQSLKDRRIELKVNQSALGEKMGMPQSHVSKIEKGLNDPRLSTISDMARLLDQELILVPREKLIIINALINQDDEQQPMWSIDKGDE